MGHTLVTGGTDNHIVLWNLRAMGLTGSKVESVANMTNVTLNKNTIAGDKSAANPGGIRLGTPAVTTRGYTPEDMVQVAQYLDRVVKISLKVQEEKGKKLVNFKKGLIDNPDIEELSAEVKEFASRFELPGL